MNARFALGAVCVAASISATVAANEMTCDSTAPCAVVVYEVDDTPSWIFRRSTYTHDPYSGARVAQYMRTPPVEPLEDERLVTSRYRRSRTNLRGAHGSVDTYYEVQAWGNGRGGIDAEWERFHDAWKESYLTGGYYNQGPAYGNQGPAYGGPWGYGGGYGPAHGYPQYGYPSGGYHGRDRGHWPGYGYPKHGHGGDDGHHGGGHDGSGHHGGGNHGGGNHGGGHDDDDGDGD
jgi:hypothetical protein